MMTTAQAVSERPTEVTVKVNDVRDLFRAHEFDPFADEREDIGSIVEMAQLPQLVSQLKKIRLRVLVPAEGFDGDTERSVQRALQRYCEHKVAQAARTVSAMRWVGVRTFLVGLVFFAISLAASAAVERLLFIPAALRTLAIESLVIAGWVVMWQPLDTLYQGWWPPYEEERTFRAIGEIPLRVEAVSD